LVENKSYRGFESRSNKLILFIIKADIYGGETRRYLSQPFENASLSHTSLAFLFSMATVFERLQILELPYDKSKISAAGEAVSEYFVAAEGSPTSYARIKVDQSEPVGEVKVWDYNDCYTPMIDEVLTNIYRPKRKRISRG